MLIVRVNCCPLFSLSCQCPALKASYNIFNNSPSWTSEILRGPRFFAVAFFDPTLSQLLRQPPYLYLSLSSHSVVGAAFLCKLTMKWIIIFFLLTSAWTKFVNLALSSKLSKCIRHLNLTWYTLANQLQLSSTRPVKSCLPSQVIFLTFGRYKKDNISKFLASSLKNSITSQARNEEEERKSIPSLKVYCNMLKTALLNSLAT
jgi:hypothetical protein